MRPARSSSARRRNATPHGREGFSTGWPTRRRRPRRASTRARSCAACATAARCGRRVAGTASDRRGARAAAQRAGDGRPGPGRVVSRPSPSASLRGGRAAHVAVLDYGVKSSIVRLLERVPAPGVTVFPRDAARPRCWAPRPGRVFLVERPRRPGGGHACRRRRPRPGRDGAAASASASATSCSARRSASRPSSSASAIAAPTTRCSSSTPAACSRSPRTTASRSSARRGAQPTSRFGAAGHARALYDGTVEGIALHRAARLVGAVPPRGEPGPARRPRPP